MYIVKVYFEDLQDNNHPYHVGDIFPRNGVSVSNERINELSTSLNRRRMPLIALEDSEGIFDMPLPETPLTEDLKKPDGQKKNRRRKSKE